MLLGGVWHGAGWTFVLWGLMHGVFLIVQHSWSRSTKNWGRVKASIPYQLCALAATFAVVQFAWVYFRSDSMQCANRICLGMLGWNGVSIPMAIWNRLGFESGDFGIVADTVGGASFLVSIAWVFTGFAIVWLLPTTQQFMEQFQPALDYSHELADDFERNAMKWRLSFRWTPSMRYALLIALVSAAGVLSLPEVSEFLYFQF